MFVTGPSPAEVPRICSSWSSSSSSFNYGDEIQGISVQNSLERTANPGIYYIKKILENALLFYTEFAVVFLLLFTPLFSVPVEYILGGHNRLRGAYL